MLTLLAFLLALALLIAVHEWGHYRMAVACGVKVLRFSLGFGPVIWGWVGRSGTEFTLSAIPLGGYVRMLDEREGPVDNAEMSQAFNRQPLWVRAAVVAAGPLANLLLAIVLYAGVAWLGLPQAKPVLSEPVPGSLAANAGLYSGLLVQRVQESGEAEQDIQSFEQFQWAITRAALAGHDLTVWTGSDPDSASETYQLALSALDVAELDQHWWAHVGVSLPWSAPVIGALQADGVAARVGLLPGDRVLRIDEQRMADAQQLRHWIRQSVNASGQGVAALWLIERQGQTLSLRVQPDPHTEAGQTTGRIGAYLGTPPEQVWLQEDFWGGWAYGWQRTVQLFTLTWDMLGRMVLGQTSVQQLSGPIAIASHAGQSASQGVSAYLGFLAAVSVSLGFFNLLPLPVLDGGHLLYYAVEAITGRQVSERWLLLLQRMGMAVLLLLMCVAIFNDVARLLG